MNDDPTKPTRTERLFDVILLEVKPYKRMAIVDVLMRNNVHRSLSFNEALIMTFRVPSKVAREISLPKAVALEMMLEVHGGSVVIRPSRKEDMDN